MPRRYSEKQLSLSGLSPHDAAHRVSAYAYGNILALATLILVTPEDVEHGHAMLVLLATGVTTFLAHTLAETQEHRVLQGSGINWEELVHALRNAFPIVSSTATPALVLILSMLHFIPGEWAWHGAILTLVGRIFSIGFVISHYRKEPITIRTWIGGAIFAVIALTVAILKAVLTH